MLAPEARAEGLGPKFDLRLASGRELVYRPQVSLLHWKSSGMPVDLTSVGMKYDGKNFVARAPFSPEAPARKARTLKLVKISLGFKCNYTCSYCSQSAHRLKEPTVPTGQLDVLLEKIAPHVPADPAGIKFELWGGEPLAYWPQFRHLVTRLRELYPAARISTVTNGTLLDDEKIDFIDSMNVSVGLSHDGPGYHLRGRDPLTVPRQRELIRELARRLTAKEMFNFNCVLTRDNHSLLEIYRYLKGHMGFDFSLSTEGVVSWYSDQQDHHGPEDEAEMRKIWRRVHEDLLTEMEDGRPFFFKVSTLASSLRNFFGSLGQSRPSSALGQKCGMDSEEALSVDVNGNVTTCQNVGASTGHKIGHLDQYDDIRLTTAKHWQNHDNCRNCPVLQLCQGSCMYLMGADRRPTCDAHFTFYFGILAAAVYYLTGEKLATVSADRVRLAQSQEVRF